VIKRNLNKKMSVENQSLDARQCIFYFILDNARLRYFCVLSNSSMLFILQVIDPVVPRYTALLKSDAILVNVAGATETKSEVQKHPKVCHKHLIMVFVE
jgi:hypothetical protein